MKEAGSQLSPPTSNFVVGFLKSKGGFLKSKSVPNPDWTEWFRIKNKNRGKLQTYLNGFVWAFSKWNRFLFQDIIFAQRSNLNCSRDLKPKCFLLHWAEKVNVFFMYLFFFQYFNSVIKQSLLSLLPKPHCLQTSLFSYLRIFITLWYETVLLWLAAVGWSDP